MWRNNLYLASVFVIIAFANPPDANCQTADVPVHAKLFSELHIDDFGYSASRLGLVAATTADMRTTWQVMNRGGSETNPLLGQSRVQQTVIAGGSVVALTFLTEALYKSGHRK